MKKILLVEDDAMLAEIYEKKFKQAGYELIHAASGGEAEEKAKAEKPDLILLDLVLPEEDGFSILKALKADSTTSRIKVVIFSNLSQEEDKEKAKVLGAEGFIAKSDFTPQQVVEEVDKIFSGINKESILSATEEVAIEDTVNEVANQAASKGDGKSILIVEDEEVFIEVFGKKLENAGFQIESAKNGAWGIKMINGKKFDLIILDIMMPAINGKEVIEQVRKDGPNKETPIIVMSNSVDEIQMEEILKAGANEFIIKTKIIPSELVDKVESMLS